ncbi:ATP-grasp domain-containing protein [Synechococcus sp. PCC 7336]|uniref:ATP-grasp domain-containing protein n=1 Tax=Synechococcus sp. PCC 7336 TaxID=195250 RepID=UPI00034A318E|nr:ATP-grasp domain-containing protein [Synechococcus sp. PCC 7336]
MRIFNHDIMTCTHEQVVGNQLFSGRVLGSTEPDDVIQLHPDLKSEWEAIAAHYNRIGLSHTENAIWDVSFHHLAGHPEREISVFYFGDAVHPDSADTELFRQLDKPWFDTVQWMNSKNNFMALADELGVSVPTTLRFSSPTEVDLDTPHIPYPCYLKPAISVDGMGIVRCGDRQALAKALTNVSAEVPLQLQEEVEAKTFLNLQYRATPHGPERVAITEQILAGYNHLGNRYPTVYDAWDLVEPMAAWIVDRGMKEIFAFDVSVEEIDGQPRYLAIECNPRYNGASYPTGIALKLNLKHWAHETFNTPHRSLRDLDFSGLEFEEPGHTGIILVNWGSILAGKLGVLLVGPPDKQLELREKVKARLQ